MSHSLNRFDPSDLDLIDPQVSQEEAIIFLKGRDWAQYYFLGGIAWTGSKDSRVIGCGGVCPIWEGRSIAWFLLDKRFDRYDLLWFARLCKIYLDRTAPRSGLRRLEVTVRQGFRAGHSFVRYLGLEYEGLLKKFDPSGNDHVMYARVY